MKIGKKQGINMFCVFLSKNFVVFPLITASFAKMFSDGGIKTLVRSVSK